MANVERETQREKREKEERLKRDEAAREELLALQLKAIDDAVAQGRLFAHYKEWWR